jgi:anaerobic selenocysteine-containing dehydrogenase
MSKSNISRRGFLKLATAGAATTAVLTGCGPASRYVVREPYANMPEYTYNGESTYYATTCQECPAGCGLVVRTMQGRAIKIEGNPRHPVNAGKTCARGQATIQGLYNPDRVQFPTRQARRSSLQEEKLDWQDAISLLADQLQNSDPSALAILVGETHDHLFDLFSDIAASLGSPAPYRYSALAAFDARQTLAQAMQQSAGTRVIPHFDLSRSDLVVSFSANFLETWLSPVAFTRQYAGLRRGAGGRRGKLVQFETRMSQTAAVADHWIPVRPGTEMYAALALGRLMAEAAGQLPAAYADVDPAEYAEIAGFELERLVAVAELFSFSTAPLFIPGGLTLAQENGVEHAAAILALNQLAADLGKFAPIFSPAGEALPTPENSASLDRLAELTEAMQQGTIKTLIVHGINPVFEIPQTYQFAEALQNVETVISFSPFPDETALASDFILPDHTPLESWGYQRVGRGTGQAVISGSQPVIVPFYDTRSTVDVILAAIQTAGGTLTQDIPFTDEVGYLEDRLSALLGKDNQLIRAGDIKTFMAQFQQFGGWWSAEPGEDRPAFSGNTTSTLPDPVSLPDGEFFLVPFISPILADKGANKPWLQETPDPTTTVMWNTWIEINPASAEELGIHDDDIVRLVTNHGEIEASVYLYPAIRPDTVAVLFGQGHTAYGRYAAGRGVNPFDLLSGNRNRAGDLILAGQTVRIERTGKHKQLARLESRIGVYGFDNEH